MCPHTESLFAGTLRASARSRGVPIAAPVRALAVALVGAFVAVLLATLLLAAAPARADVFGPISLVSKTAIEPESATQQGEYAHDAAISGNGRYVAFDGAFGGVTGVWRRDLQTGEIQPVAVGDVGDEAVSAPDASLPSISESGQYVSFTTTAALDPADDANKGPDVYVRNMSIPVYGCEPNSSLQGCDAAIPSCEAEKSQGVQDPRACQPAPEGAFALASAVNGSTVGLTYSYGSEPLTEAAHYGSIASGRSALSADGRHVVFVTTAPSNLAGAGTPALQVAVRDLDTHSTQLVSVAYDPETGGPTADQPVSGSEGGHAYGAVYTAGGVPPSFPTPSRAYKMTVAVGASISADASTVAWMGQDISKQAPMLSGETVNPSYAEPLWRRFADGPQAPTQRITGGSEASNPACLVSGETILPVGEVASLSDPCQGPFESRPTGTWSSKAGSANAVPQLSGDGRIVVFPANAKLMVRGANFGLGEDAPSDLYVANMSAGLTRVQALRALTEFASGNTQDLAEDAPIVDFAISPDGSQLAFTTVRTTFPLGSPAYVSQPATIPGMLELFDIDLADDTLTRVTHGYEGGASEQPHKEVQVGTDPYGSVQEAGALSPSFTDDGGTLAFSSTASNLVYGDGNTPQIESTVFDGSDAFVVSRVIFGSTPTPQEISSAPAGPSLASPWLLGATVFSRPDGSVVLDVELPGAGALHAVAEATVVVKIAGSARSGRRARRGSAHAAHARATVVTRVVATYTRNIGTSGLISFTLKLAPRYAKLATQAGGLSAILHLSFSAPAHPVLRESIDVTFLGRAKSAHAPAGTRRTTTTARRRSARGRRR